MSFIPVHIECERADFDRLYAHMRTAKPGYSNMHLRSTNQRKSPKTGKTTTRMRCLYILHAHAEGYIEGRVSGPNISAHFLFIRRGEKAFLRFPRLTGAAKEQEWLAKGLISRLIRRMEEERTAKQTHYSNYLPGEFYVRRAKAGMSKTHPHCRKAVRSKMLDDAFVSQLESWQLELVHP